MSTQSLNPIEFAELISNNQNNPEFMNRLMELLQTNIPSGDDAGLASSVNNEAQNASSEESAVVKVLQEEETLQTVIPSVNDADLASTNNNEVHNVSSDVMVVETLFQEEKVSKSVKPTDPVSVKSSTQVQPSTTDNVAKKARTFKPKETLQIQRKYYTIEEVADAFRIGKSTLHKYLKEKKIHGIKIGNQWRFSEEALEAFEKGL